MWEYSSSYIRIIRKDTKMRYDTGYRLAWLDALRGLTVISMVFYHLLWDVVYLMGRDYAWYKGTPGFIWQQSICWSFIIISGFSFNLSRNPAIRGVAVSLCGAAVMLVTWLFTPDIAVKFGILTLLGASMIICGILKPVLIKIPSVIGLIVSALLFIVFGNVNTGYLGFYGINFMQVPHYLYSNYLTTFLGFPFQGFTSTDYFSLFPWIFLYMFGLYLHKLYSEMLYSPHEYEKPVPVIGWIGRFSLLIYLVHQPVIYGIMDLVNYLKR